MLEENIIIKYNKKYTPNNIIITLKVKKKSNKINL